MPPHGYRITSADFLNRASGVSLAVSVIAGAHHRPASRMGKTHGHGSLLK
jgi:hypothetical protein